MMNKKEQAAFADLQEQLRIAKALRFTEPVERDVEPPECGIGREIRNGYDYNAFIGPYGRPRVEPACTSSVYHSFGQHNKTDSQNPRRLFSTKLLALKAMRNDVELKCAKILADIDLQMEQEKELHDG